MTKETIKTQLSRLYQLDKASTNDLKVFLRNISEIVDERLVALESKATAPTNADTYQDYVNAPYMNRDEAKSMVTSNSDVDLSRVITELKNMSREFDNDEEEKQEYLMAIDILTKAQRGSR